MIRIAYVHKDWKAGWKCPCGKILMPGATVVFQNERNVRCIECTPEEFARLYATELAMAMRCREGES